MKLPLSIEKWAPQPRKNLPSAPSTPIPPLPSAPTLVPIHPITICYKRLFSIIRDKPQTNVRFNDKIYNHSIIIFVVVYYDLNIKQLNIVTAFLYEIINQLLYVQMSKEYEQSDIICKYAA